MKKQLTIIIGLLLSSSITVHAQVAQKLRELGMENIRTIETGGTTVAAFEDNVYRGTYRGVGKAIIAGMEGMGNGNLELVALDGNGIPQLSISLPDTLIAGYKSGEISLKEVYERTYLFVFALHIGCDGEDHLCRCFRSFPQVHFYSWRQIDSV